MAQHSKLWQFKRYFNICPIVTSSQSLILIVFFFAIDTLQLMVIKWNSYFFLSYQCIGLSEPLDTHHSFQRCCSDCIWEIHTQLPFNVLCLSAKIYLHLFSTPKGETGDCLWSGAEKSLIKVLYAGGSVRCSATNLKRILVELEREIDLSGLQPSFPVARRNLLCSPESHRSSVCVLLDSPALNPVCLSDVETCHPHVALGPVLIQQIFFFNVRVLTVLERLYPRLMVFESVFPDKQHQCHLRACQICKSLDLWNQEVQH